MGCAGSKPVATSTVVPENTNNKDSQSSTSTSITTQHDSTNTTQSNASSPSNTNTKVTSPKSSYNLLKKLPSFVTTSSLEGRYTLGKVLGRGGFGEVREAIRKSDGKR